MVQWLRLHASKAGGLDSIPGQETRSHMLQLRRGAAKKKRLNLDSKVSTFSNKKEIKKEKTALRQQYSPVMGGWETTAMSRQEVVGTWTAVVAGGMERT